MEEERRGEEKRAAREEFDYQAIGGPLQIGLDPDLKARRRLVRKVRKVLKKSAETSSSSSSTSSASSRDLGMEGEELLQDRSKVHRIAVLAPGLLSAQTVANMKPFLS